MSFTSRLLALLLLITSFIAPLCVAQTILHDLHNQHDAHTAAQERTATRTIHVDMNDDMRFSPASIKVKPGDTIEFIVSNSGKLRHEMVFGSDAALRAHYAAMLKHPDMQHTDPDQITLEPGRQGKLIRHFGNAGSFSFACLQPGHYDAGMQGRIIVSDDTQVQSRTR